MKLTRVILSTCAVASSIVCISAYSVASSEPSVNFTVAKPCSQESAPKPKMEILEPLGPLHAIAEPDILEAFKSRVGAMKASGEYDRRFNQNKDRIARELEHPTPVAGLKKATEMRVWELSASVPETLPESLLRQAQSVPMPHLSRSLLFIDGTDFESLKAAQKLYESQKDMRVVLVNGAPAEVSEKLHRRVFFDQGGALVRVFGIEAVPALLFNGPEGPTGANITVGLNMSFWEPLRTAEVVRTPYCFPSLGGMELNVGIRAPAHGRTPNKSTSAQRSSFYQVHWYFTPWLFILEVLLDTKCLEQSAWDLAYMTELDPLWDDSVTTFFLNPDASLFANPAAAAACAADCLAATSSLPVSELYWCAGCHGGIFPLTGWVGSHVHFPQASSLLVARFTMKLHRSGLQWAAYGEKGQCGPYLEPIMDKRVYRTQMMYPSRTTGKQDGRCCYPMGASTSLWHAGKTWASGGEDAAYLIYRKRDCCQGAGIQPS